MKRLILLVFLILIPSLAHADIHWVDTAGGAANWAACAGTDPGAGNRCSMSQANAGASEGDTVTLMTGTYTTGIEPANSGSAGNLITFVKGTGQTPTFAGAGLWAINLQNKSYVKIDGITVGAVNKYYFIGNGAHHIEITNSTFDGDNKIYFCLGSLTDYDSGSSTHTTTHNNWIHSNTFSHFGGQDDCGNGGAICQGYVAAGDMPQYNTYENNVFSYGGHDLLNIQSGQYTVIRNNVFHNEEAYFPDTGGCTNSPVTGYFGNRNLITENNGSGTTGRNLIESNRVGYAGTPSNDDGAMGIENAAEYQIIRYNFVYGNGASGIYGKSQGTGPNHARIYNNTLYYNGFGDLDIDGQYKYAILIWCWSGAPIDDTIIKNNIDYNNSSGIVFNSETYCTNSSISNNLTANPSFLNTTMTDKTSLTNPTLAIGSGSAAIDGGTYLTTAHGAGNNSTSLVVHDSLYFQAGSAAATSQMGSSLSSVAADWIAIGTVGNVHLISDINYATNTITLATPTTWTDDASVWLYKKSDGTIVLYGTAPDYGAYEYEDTTAPVLSNLIPTGQLNCATDPGNKVLYVTTNENANCRHHASSVTWSEMSPMDSTGTTSHSTTVNYACNASYTRKVICQDLANPANESAAGTWSFSIAAEAGSNKQILNIGVGSQSITIGGGSKTISW